MRIACPMKGMRRVAEMPSRVILFYQMPTAIPHRPNPPGSRYGALDMPRVRGTHSLLTRKKLLNRPHCSQSDSANDRALRQRDLCGVNFEPQDSCEFPRSTDDSRGDKLLFHKRTGSGFPFENRSRLADHAQR